MRCPACETENAEGAASCFTCGRALDALTQGHLLAGRYEIKRPLGKGGMGHVYEAYDRVLEEPVAIKVLRAELSWDPEISKRFFSEIKLARKVSHRNVCRIHDHGEEGGINFISMEFIPGQSLKERLAQQRPSVDEAFELTQQVALGVAAIHEHGIVHRDLKTGNIMTTGAGVVKIVDFGIAKQVGAAGLTAGDRVFGTPEYMSPEQVEGVAVDGRSDVYALGCVTYEIFTGRPPFQGDTPYATLLKHLKEAPRLEGVPPGLAAVLGKALAKNPADRFSTVGEFVTALRASRSETGPFTPLTAGAATATSPRTMTILRGLPEAKPSSRRAWLGAAAVAAVALGTWLLLPRAEAPQPTAPVTEPPASIATASPPPPTTTLASAPTLSPARGARARVPDGVIAAMPPPASATPTPAPSAPPPTTTLAAAVAPTTTLPAPATTGTLALILVPDAEAVIDGRSLGTLGRRDVTLEAGPHALEVRHPDYEPLPRRFTIRVGETLTLLLDLQEKGIRKPTRK